jgi:hypothetical protein
VTVEGRVSVPGSLGRWLPWVAAIVAWNLSFDYQVRAEGARFVEAQLSRRASGEPPQLIRDQVTPRVWTAAAGSTGLALLVLLGGRWWVARRGAPPAHGSTHVG